MGRERAQSCSILQPKLSCGLESQHLRGLCTSLTSLDAGEDPSSVNAQELCPRACKPAPHLDTPGPGAQRSPPALHCPSQTRGQGPQKSRRSAGAELCGQSVGLAGSPSLSVAVPPTCFQTGLTSVSWPRGSLLPEAGRVKGHSLIRINRAELVFGGAGPPRS